MHGPVQTSKHKYTSPTLTVSIIDTKLLVSRIILAITRSLNNFKLVKL